MSAALGSAVTSPRTRGGVSFDPVFSRAAAALSPHARGCFSSLGRGPRAAVPLPARAGVFRPGCRSSTSRSASPRTRGGVSTTDRVAVDIKDPLPARAGVFRSLTFSAMWRASSPRTRGGVSRCQSPSSRNCALSPHARGCFVGGGYPGGVESPLPARAGVFPIPADEEEARGASPRTRGGVSTAGQAKWERLGLSPHARGCFRGWTCGPWHRRPLPARAGVFPRVDLRALAPAASPRTRGGVSEGAAVLRRRGSLSPHARGCFVPLGAGGWGAVPLPARAGVFRTRPGCGPTGPPSPRTRGGVSPGGLVLHSLEDLSPHARGCFEGGDERCGRHRPLPARAGVFRSGTGRRWARTPSPRTRGGVSRCTAGMPLSLSLSPQAAPRGVVGFEVGSSVSYAPLVMAAASSVLLVS